MPLQPILSPRLSRNDDCLPPYEDEADYIDQMKSFLVPELESPEGSCVCSLPSGSMECVQLGMASTVAMRSRHAGAASASAEASRQGSKDALNHADQGVNQSLKRSVIEAPLNQVNLEESSDNKPPTLSTGRLDVPEDRCKVHPALRADEGAVGKSHLSHDALNTRQPGSQILRRSEGWLKPKEQNAAAGEESQSTVLTAEVDQLLDMSLTDSTSSPLLTPGIYRGRSGEGGLHLRRSRCDAETISPKLDETGPAVLEPGVPNLPPDASTVTDVNVCSRVTSSTPIASVQTLRSKRAPVASCRPHSRIPSSIYRAQPKLAAGESKSSCVQTNFSFTEHAFPQAVSTPNGFRPHQMWGMGDIACTAPQLQLSEAAAVEQPVLGASLDQEKEMGTACSGLPHGSAICSLTPVATQALMSCSGADASKQQGSKHPDAASQNSRPPSHCVSQHRGKIATRIPTCHNVRKRSNVAATESICPSTPGMGAPKTPLPGEASDGHVKLVLGSGELACLSNPRPSVAQDQLKASEVRANEVPMIGTPPYNKLMRFLRNPNPASVSDSSALAQADSIQDDETSPVRLENQVMTSSAKASDRTEHNPVFRQLLENIEAQQYRSPAVNFASFVVANHSEDSDPEECRQLKEGSLSMSQSGMGENGFEEVTTKEVDDEPGNKSSITDQLLPVMADGCCSRVSDMCPEHGDFSERSVGMGASAPIALETSSTACSVMSGNLLSTHPLYPEVEPVAVIISVTELEDGTGQVQLCLHLRNDTDESFTESTPMMNSAQNGTLSSGSAFKDHLLNETVQGLAVDICDDIAVSCTVNVGGFSPVQRDDTADVASVSVDAINHEVLYRGATGSLEDSVSISRDRGLFSPPQLCTSPDSTHALQPDYVQPRGLHSPIKSLSPDHAAMAVRELDQQSPVVAHIEMVKEMIRSGQLPKPSDRSKHCTGLPEILDTPKCSQMVTDIHGSFRATPIAPSAAPGSGLFTQWLDANGIRSAVKPGGTSYCVIGDLWKRQRETDEEFQGFKTMELENAALTEQEHADDIRKLQDEKAEIIKRAVEAEQRAHLLAEELDCVRQELAATQKQLLSMKASANATSLDDQLPPLASTGQDSEGNRSSSDWTPASVEDQISEVVDHVKGLEELIISVCRRSCTQNNSHSDFVQIYSYFHQMKVRLQNGRMHITQRAKSNIDNVRAFVSWAKPSIAELCACYDTTAKEVTRRSVDIARMRKMGNFADGALLKNQAENSDLHQHLEGVSVSMRWHVYEVFSQLHKIGQTLTIAVKSGQSVSLEGEDSLNLGEVKDDEIHEGQHLETKQDFIEPLSLMLGRRAKAIQGQLESMSLGLDNRHQQCQIQAEHTDLDLAGNVAALESTDTPINKGTRCSSIITPLMSLAAISKPVVQVYVP